jgi:hypothetical protein
MSVPNRSLPTIPVFTQDLKLRYGGTEVAATPDVGATSMTEVQALNSLLQQLGPALAQIKAIGDLVSAILALIEFTKAVPAAVKEGDPDVLLDAAKAVAEIADKIAPHVPFLEHVVTVMDALKVMKAALGAVSATLGHVSMTFDDASSTLSAAQSTGNTSLETLAAELQSCAESQLDASKVSVGLVLKPLEIVAQIARNIPAPPSLPEIPDLSAVTGIDELIEIVDDVYSALDAIV